MSEMNKNGKIEQTINVIKRVMNKLVSNGSGGLLCDQCHEIKEVQTLQKLLKQEVFDKKKFQEM